MEHFTIEQVGLWLKEIVSKNFNIPEAALVPQARLREDLDLDSIDLFDLLVHLEKKSGVVLDGDGLRSAVTIADFLDLLVAMLNTPDLTAKANQKA